VRVTSRVQVTQADEVAAAPAARHGGTQGALGRVAVGQVVLGDAGRVDLWSRATRGLLRGFFGDPDRAPRRLPAPLAVPIARLLAMPPGADGRPAVVGHAFTFRRHGEELICRVLQHPRSGRLVLVVALRPSTATA